VTRSRGERYDVLVAGGGVAGLEGALTLRELAPEMLDVEVLCPEEVFNYRPLAVAEPFGGPEVRIPLAAIANDAGFRLRKALVEGVEPAARRVLIEAGEALSYDALLVAIGARPVIAVPGALTFRGREEVAAFRQALAALPSGRHHRIAFVAPTPVGWTLPLYELALMTAAWARERGLDLRIWLVTREGRPLDIFGEEASCGVDRLLREAGIELRTASVAEEFADGRLWIEMEGAFLMDLVVALPALEGPALHGLPHDDDGFVPVDELGRVAGLEHVFAAGDATTRQVKQGGLAAQQAEAAAGAIAARAGAAVEPGPHVPVLRAALLTGDRPRYLRRTAGDSAWASAFRDYPLWWPAHKLAGRRLAVHLARRHDTALSTWTGDSEDDDIRYGARLARAPIDPAGPARSRRAMPPDLVCRHGGQPARSRAVER
jgi:NADH dehydrogenase FAD-containing subunit